MSSSSLIQITCLEINNKRKKDIANALSRRRKMLEEQPEVKMNIPKIYGPKNSVAYYFAQVRELELSRGYLHFLSTDAKEFYGKELERVYDILYDRVMTSTLSPFLKQELEQWYTAKRDFLGFCDPVKMNWELERILDRFELL